MKCAYPPCSVQIESGGENPPAFCEKHLAVKCNFPPCQETIVPNSDVCEKHREMVHFFDWLHGVRHQQAMQQQIVAQQAQAVMRQAGLGGNGKGNVRLLRP